MGVSPVHLLEKKACLNDQLNAVTYNQNYEINRDLFILTPTLLGQGEFGRIFKGEVKINENDRKRSVLPVAVKIPKGNNIMICVTGSITV